MSDPVCCWCYQKLSEHEDAHCEHCGFSHLRCDSVPQVGAYEDMINRRGSYAPKKLKMMKD